MDSVIPPISLLNLVISFIPVALVFAFFVYWSLGIKKTHYALSRMWLQLLTIGYCLTFLFNTETPWVIAVVLLVMVVAASWISLNEVQQQRRDLFFKALAAISLGGGITLAIIIFGVLQLSPWFQPQFIIPLSGMIFANAMNAISLAAERFNNELAHQQSYQQARNIAFSTALIPITNSLFAVGLVSIPGMMSGQILSGIAPAIAARYQIMVMCMLFASAGLSTALFLTLCRFSTRQSDNI